MIATPDDAVTFLQAGGVSPMQEFGAMFDNVKFRKGLQLNFTSSKDGDLITQVDNKQVSHVRNQTAETETAP